MLAGLLTLLTTWKPVRIAGSHAHPTHIEEKLEPKSAKLFLCTFKVEEALTKSP